MSITRRLFPSRWGHSRVSAYVYMPPGRRRWPLVAAFAAGAICVFALVRSPATSPTGDTAAKVALPAARDVWSVPQAFLMSQPESAPIDTATAAEQSPEATTTTLAPAKAKVRQSAAKSASAHRRVANKSRQYKSRMQAFARSFDSSSGGYRTSGHPYGAYGSYGFNAN
jgi:hypothetical protein